MSTTECCRTGGSGQQATGGTKWTTVPRMGITDVVRAARSVGVDLIQTRAAARGVRPYLRRRSEFMAEAARHNDFAVGRTYPSFGDASDQAGEASGQYFHQDLYVAQQVFAAAPERHIDVGSRIDGFVAHVATFRPIEVLDMRPLEAGIPNLTFSVRDVTEEDPAFDEITDSLSSLHAVEHFGLGRYGGPIDYFGFRSGFENLARMVRPGGTFYFSVPIGEHQRVEFDAHRIFSIPYLLRELIRPRFSVGRFAYVDDNGSIHRDQDVDSREAERTFGLSYGCGIFTLRRT